MSRAKKEPGGGPAPAVGRKNLTNKSTLLRSSRQHRRWSNKEGFRRAHANIVAAAEKAPSMSTFALELALRQAEDFMFGPEPATFVPDFALAAAAVGELSRRRAALLPFDEEPHDE